MNLREHQKGFTIVELLIVVVVIAILAAISIVAYTGITDRANKSAAMEAANSVKSVATTYNGANSAYPLNKDEFVDGGSDPIAKLPSDIVFSCTALDGNQTPKTVQVNRFPSGTGAITGYIITYRDFTDDTNKTMTVGETSGTSTTFLDDDDGNCS